MATLPGEYLLVLGASSDQLFMIKTAQEMGLKVLAVDANADAPGSSVADAFAHVSTRDVEAVCSYLQQFQQQGAKVLGVSTMGSDIPEVVASIAAYLGTPSISLEDARVAVDKISMKLRFAEHHVPIPWFCEIGSYDELQQIIDEHGYNLVIKPNDRSGSRGVFLLDANTDCHDLFNRSREFSFSKRVLVEEFLPGLQISTETIMVDGRAYTPGFADRNYELLDRFRPQILENGGWVPTILSDEEVRAVNSLVEKASLALGVRNGVTKGDVVMTAEGPKMIEMAARLSGGDFSESLVPLGSGVNYVETVIEMAVGRKPNLDKLKPRFNKAVSNRYFFPKPGRLIRIEGEEEVRSWDWVEKLEFWYQEGDTVPEMTSHASRFGVFIVSADDRDELEQRIARVYAAINIVIDEND